MLFSRPEVMQQLSNMLILYGRQVNQQLLNFVTSRLAKLINSYPTSYSEDQQVHQRSFNLELFRAYIRMSEAVTISNGSRILPSHLCPQNALKTKIYFGGGRKKEYYF